MMAFDGITREVCTVERSRTNTPQQALVLLNDTQFVEAARALAQRTLKLESEDDDERLRFAFTALAGRPPDQQELIILNVALIEQRDHFDANYEDAPKLIQAGDSTPDGQIDPQELAAWTVICQTILNLDATIWKR